MQYKEIDKIFPKGMRKQLVFWKKWQKKTAVDDLQSLAVVLLFPVFHERNALGAQFFDGYPKKMFGGERRTVLTKPPHDGGGRLHADLLAREGAYESFEKVRNNRA